MLTMDQIHDIRIRFFEKGENISQIATTLHLDWKTVQKYVDQIDFNLPVPKPASEQRFCPKLDPYNIDQWLEEDKNALRKQRHTAKRVYNRLRKKFQDFDCSYRTVASYYAVKHKELFSGPKDGFPPLEHKPGEAQVDFGTAEFYENGNAVQYGWEMINPSNMKGKFMDMVRTMDMSFSYKPVLLKAMLKYVNENGRVMVEDIINYFMDYYRDRKENGQIVEKSSSIYGKNEYSRKEVERNIFANPFKRFEDMRFMNRCKEIEYVEFNRHIFKKLSTEEKEWIVRHCDEKLEEYYRKIGRF